MTPSLWAKSSATFCSIFKNEGKRINFGFGKLDKTSLLKLPQFSDSIELQLSSEWIYEFFRAIYTFLIKAKLLLEIARYFTSCMSSITIITFVNDYHYATCYCYCEKVTEKIQNIFFIYSSKSSRSHFFRYGIKDLSPTEVSPESRLSYMKFFRSRDKTTRKSCLCIIVSKIHNLLAVIILWTLKFAPEIAVYLSCL